MGIKFLSLFSMLGALVVFVALAVLFFRPAALPLTHADATHNITGWAWNGEDEDGVGGLDGGFGWISFNCTNDPFDCTSTNYGVHLDIDTDVFSGYAWGGTGDPGLSPAGIGWIDFNPSVGCPLAPCEARANRATGEVLGWARALAFGGGWDGWISLNCLTEPSGCTASNNHHVTVEVLAVPGGKIQGFAWGGNDTDGNSSVDGGPGWIEFTNVVFNDTFNDPPVAVVDNLFANESIVAATTDLDVLANDSDPNGDPLTIVSITQPASGTITIIGGGTMLSYAPNAGFISPPEETFTYKITDGRGAFADGSATIFVYDCGDGIRQLAESCDGTDFGPSTCQTEGVFVGGQLVCTALCTIDTVQCVVRPQFDFREF
jgi:hypothetical protein